MVVALRRHYNGVARTLEEEPGQYLPMLELDERDGAVVWKPWMLGFARAVRLRPGAWSRIVSIDDLDVQEALLVIKRLYHGTNGTSNLEPMGLDLLDEMAPMLICGMVGELSALRPLRGGAKSCVWEVTEVSVSTAEEQVPCPCGSGRRYGRCCGTH